MRIDEGMPATLIVGNQELGCFVKHVDGDSIGELDGTRIFSRIDEVVVIPWRSPYASEEESPEALRSVIGEAVAK